MLQVICRPEATSKEEAYTFHTVHSKTVPCQISHLVKRSVWFPIQILLVSPGERPRKLYAERALNLPLGAELITGNMWYPRRTFLSSPCAKLSFFSAPFSMITACVSVFSDLLSTSSNSEGQDAAGGAHADCPFQRRIIPAHRLRPRRTHPEIFQVRASSSRSVWHRAAGDWWSGFSRRRTLWTNPRTLPLRRNRAGRFITSSDFILGSGSTFYTTDSP